MGMLSVVVLAALAMALFPLPRFPIPINLGHSSILEFLSKQCSI